MMTKIFIIIQFNFDLRVNDTSDTTFAESLAVKMTWFDSVKPTSQEGVKKLNRFNTVYIV